jgi:hypothetical protein
MNISDNHSIRYINFYELQAEEHHPSGIPFVDQQIVYRIQNRIELKRSGSRGFYRVVGHVSKDAVRQPEVLRSAERRAPGSCRQVLYSVLQANCGDF